MSEQPDPFDAKRRDYYSGIRWPRYGSVLGTQEAGQCIVKAKDLHGHTWTATGPGEIWHLDHITLEDGIEVKVWIGGAVAMWDDGHDHVLLAEGSEPTA